jgi:hypothetical protein
MKRSLLIPITIAGIFACGGVTGWFLRPVFVPEPPAQITVEKRLPTPSKTIASLDERLHFTDAQKSALQPILEEWAKVARAAEMPMREKRYEVFLTTSPRIRALLTPGQQKEYDRITENVRAGWERRTKTGDE